MIALHHGGPTADTLKLLIALAELGLAVDGHRVDAAALAQWSDAHRALAPQGQLPVLVDDGEVMNESAFALQYLAEAYQPRLAPADPLGWYDIQASIATIDAALAPNLALLGWHSETDAAAREAHRAALAAVPGRDKPAGWSAVFSDAEASEDQLANARERIGQAIEQIEASLAKGDWLVGDAYSIADINGFALARTLPGLVPELANRERSPRLLAWLDRIAARPAIAVALAGAGAGATYVLPA